jgi:hypothetical protein
VANEERPIEGEAVRILWFSAALFAVAGCTAWVGPLPAAEAPPSAPAPAVVAVASPPPPAATLTLAGLPDFVSLVLPQIPLPPGRLTLSNFSFRLADVEAIVTAYPDCSLHPGMVPTDFKLPLNSTWVITAPPGMDVCWRSSLPPTPEAPKPVWTEWNRDYTGQGRSIDTRL